MPHRKYMAILKLDEAELRSRRAFFELGDDDLARLAAMRPLAEKWVDEIVDGLYDLLLHHADSKRFFTDDATVRRIKRAQRDYFLALFAGRCDLAYVEDRLRVGTAHERIGLPPKWYLGAYRRYLALLQDKMATAMSAADAGATFSSLLKLVHFDEALALDAYFAATLDTLARHQAAIRELSTPVIKVHDRILLLPLVGSVDSQRAQQVMESVLLRVVEEQAKVLIIDIAGVPVVDTRVADNLVKTTSAVHLLGASTVLTGISAQVARTIVQLGLDISSMHTLAKLSDGIAKALSLIGREIVVRAPHGAA